MRVSRSRTQATVCVHPERWAVAYHAYRPTNRGYLLPEGGKDSAGLERSATGGLRGNSWLQRVKPGTSGLIYAHTSRDCDERTQTNC